MFVCHELNSWVTYFENRKRSPGTIKTYLGSVKLFYDYVMINSPAEIMVNY